MKNKSSSKAKYSVPLICSGGRCDMDLGNITRNDENVEAGFVIDVNPGDEIKFTLDESAGDFAIVVALNEALVTTETQYLRIKRGKSKSVKINRKFKGPGGADLNFLLYCSGCGCSASVADSGFESVKGGAGFSVKPKPPKPKKSEKSSAKRAG